MRVTLLFSLALLFSTTLTAQSIRDSLVLTKDQNDKWIATLERQQKSKQLDLIRKRILLDTNVYIAQAYADRIRFDHEKEQETRIEGYGKPLLIVNGMHYAYINNKTNTKSIIKLAEYLTDNRIKSVSIMRDAHAAAIYGSRAVCGAILLTTKDKKTFNRIKEINTSAE